MAHSRVTEIMEDQTDSEIVKVKTDSQMSGHRADRVNMEDKTGEGKFTKTERRLREFVVMVTLQVLEKCRALKDSNMEMLLSDIQRLVNKTMEGLPVVELLSQNVGSKTVAKAVVTELRAKYGKKLKYMLLLKNPAVESIVVQCFQAHIRAPPGQAHRGLDEKLGALVVSLWCIHMECDE
ncbi:hypothetical protein F2P81_001478 [Scophthalmus maximus]|uniref:Uncharacterized protein n=1 Tax=Scophthalmus maximus TaxID=52904 RepID=A0A6A4TJG2_SCOMX|nr:hypothetical protein F2P81_001478 [Scophthalmus maximus]